jgi:ankyrin repeat domain-containing protein 50
MLRRLRRDIDIEEALKTLPKGLDKTYQRIINQIDQQDHHLQVLAQKTLMWVFYAKRPLSIKELVDAIAIDNDCLTREDLDLRLYPEDAIFEACANLLTREGSVVRPIHYSVREYFTKPSNNDSSKFLSCIANRNLAYALLSNCCVRYLMIKPLADGPCNNEDSFINCLYRSPLAAHSAYVFDYYFVQLDSVPPYLKRNLNQLLLGSERTLASILQIRRLRDNIGIDNIFAAFGKFEDSVLPEDIIYATALYDSRQLLSINNSWEIIKAPRYALHRAAGSGMLNAITPLIEAGQDVRVEDTYGLTPLYYACEGGYIEICTLLIKHGANVNTRGGFYGTALQAASYGGHEAVVALLLEKGADVNAQGSGYYNTALQVASDRGHEAVVALLLEKGADNTKRYT